MDPRRLRILLALARLGSMREVAETLHMTTSSVSQQIAVLTREAGIALIEPEGRRVRLTPAGLRLADHAVTILAALDAAQRDLDPHAEPAGTVRVGGFATGIRVSLLPALATLAESHPAVRVIVSEYEPLEAFRLLADDDLDLALTYDYNLAPVPPDAVLQPVALWTSPWGLAVRSPAAPATDLTRFRDENWIVNSRNTADETVLRTVTSLAGFTPRITHQIDSLDLVEELVAAGYGIGLLPLRRPTMAGITVLPLPAPGVEMTAYAVVRQGRSVWPPLQLILNRLRPNASPALPDLQHWPRSNTGNAT